MRSKSIPRWLHRAALLLIVLAGSTAVQAQEEIEGGEAFYIYQNDGHFDGFFYDEVKQISYSRFDTLGVEHAGYVSQEIVTADSTYRFMLTAIDSVSFVQPEIKYKPQVRFMRDEGMMDYFLGCDEGIIMFKLDMPANLRPQQGDVLVCPEITDFEGGSRGAFVGRITGVTEFAEWVLVYWDYINHYNEVFDQFITVEQVRNEATPNGPKVRRRMAGLKKLEPYEGNYTDVPLFNASASIEGSVPYKSLTLALALNATFGMTVSASYKISWDEFYIKTTVKSQMGIGATISADGELYEDANLSALPGVGKFVSMFTKIPFPANFPILYAEIVPAPFGSVSAHVNLSLSAGLQVNATAFSAEISDKYPYLGFRIKSIHPFLPVDQDLDGNLSASLQINGSFHTGLDFPIKLGTQPWLGRFINWESGLSLKVGPKVSGAVNFDIKELTSGSYSLLKDTKVDFTMLSLNSELKGEASIFSKAVTLKHTKTWDYGTYCLKLFPEFAELKASLSGDNEDVVDASYDVSGDVFLPQEMGVGIYTKADDDDIYYTKLYKSAFRDETYFLNTFNSVKLSIPVGESGEYRVRPVIRLFNMIIPVNPQEAVVVIEPKELMLKPEQAFAEEGGDQLYVTLMTKQNTPITVEPQCDWLTGEIVGPDGSSKYQRLRVSVAENLTNALRTGTIKVRQQYTAKQYVDRYFTVKQYGGLQIEPTTLNFKTDGGTQTVSVLTSLSPINVNTDGADWIDYNLNDRTLQITTTPNKGAERRATVVISAWNDRYNGISTVKLEVVQAGDIDASIDRSQIDFKANGGTQRVNINLGTSTFNGASVSDSGKEWVIIENGINYVNITALPNTTGYERSCYVDCSVSGKSAEGLNTTALLTVKVTQQAGTATVTPSEVHFGMDGGKQQVKVDMGIFPYCGALIPQSASSWLDAEVAADGTITFIAKSNPYSEQRQCEVTCYVSGVADPGDSEMIKLPVKVVQDGQELTPVTPDGDKSPFKAIRFYVTRYCKYVSQNNGTTDEVLPVTSRFNFEPDNSAFTVNYGKTVNHYECTGYAELTQNNEKLWGQLSFDIDKKKKTVKNLKFSGVSNSEKTIHMWGVYSHSANHAAVSLSLGEFPLQTNSSTYKEGRYTVSNGLKFNSYSNSLNQKTWYTQTELGDVIFGEEGFEPGSDHIDYLPVGDTRDEVYLTITYKDGQEEPADLEWPSDEVMNSLKAGGMPVYEGGAPPSVAGTYSLSPISIVKDYMDATAEMDGYNTLVVNFSSQSNGQLKFNGYWAGDGFADSALGSQPALIKGNGSSFTICVPSSDTTFVLSGTMSGGTISNLHFAATTDTPGQYFIMKDGSGTASKTTWAPGSDEY